MKILIIGFAKIKYMPYLNFYLENINKDKNDVHLLYWNRDMQEEDISHIQNVTLHEYKHYQEDDVSRLTKIGSFLKFRHFAKNLIKKENFDFVIVLTSVVAVLLSDVLKQYKGKYIYDYRDITYENFAPYKRVVEALVKNSYYTFVSSDGFRKYLPEACADKIFTTYNILVDSFKHRDEKLLYGTDSRKIRIAFWGYIRHEHLNMKIIDRLKNDDRFELHYYGREQDIAKNIKKYVADTGVENVFFHGEYKPEDRYGFVRNTDIIHNMYDDSNMMLAVGNKYYDGIIFCLPQICTEGSYMGELVESKGIGVALDPDSESFNETIFDYYININNQEFRKKCDEEAAVIEQNYTRLADIIKSL